MELDNLDRLAASAFDGLADNTLCPLMLLNFCLDGTVLP
jgi:hypothetical protein